MNLLHHLDSSPKVDFEHWNPGNQIDDQQLMQVAAVVKTFLFLRVQDTAGSVRVWMNVQNQKIFI